MMKFSQKTLPTNEFALILKSVAAISLLTLLPGCGSQSGNNASESFASSSDALITCIDASVTSQSNAQLAIESVKEARQVMTETIILREHQQEALIDLNSDYTATRDQFNTLLRQHATQIDASKQRLMALANQFRNALSDAELAACQTQRDNYAGSVVALLNAT
jgi:hypothetical protein